MDIYIGLLTFVGILYITAKFYADDYEDFFKF